MRAFLKCNLLLCFLLLFTVNTSRAQIICIMCYNQNDSISSGVSNLLVNGGFENGTCLPWPNQYFFCPSSINYNCNIANWTCTGGGSATYACLYDATSSIIMEGIQAAYLGNSFPLCCSPALNDTSCISNMFCEVTGMPNGYPLSDPSYGGTTGVSLSQTVNGLIPGNTYVLEFWAGGEGFNFFVDRGLFAVDVGFGNSYLRCKPTTSASADTGTTFIIEFNATATSHTIKFTNWGHVCNTCTEVVLDNVRLYTLAELSASVNPCGSSVVPGANLASSDTSWCDKKSIDFFDLSTNNPTSWQWYFQGAVPDTSNLQNPSGIYYPSYGSFDVMLVACNSAGCDTLSLPAFINEFQLPPVPVLTSNGDTLFSDPAYSYQWYYNSAVIPGATGQYNVCLQPGSYYVLITDSNGCSTPSNAVNTAITEFQNQYSDFQVAFLPSDGNIEIITGKKMTGKSVVFELYDETGRIIYFNSIPVLNAVTRIGLGNSPDGFYLLRISAGNNSWNRKVLIQRD